MASLGNPQNTIAVLQKYQFDTHVLDKIISAANITKEDMVLEVGPGIGTMTQYLCEHAREVVAVEIDKNLIPILGDTLSEYDNVSVIHDDILKVDIEKIVQEKNAGKPIKVVANLPYYITTPIIMGLFESHVPIENITVMVQKEGLWSFVPGCTILCRTLYCGECTTKLLYAKTKGRFCGDSSYQTQ